MSLYTYLGDYSATPAWHSRYMLQSVRQWRG